MKRIASAVAIFGAIVVSGGAAQGASSKTFVAAGGSDTGEVCAAAAPCATFLYAYNKTNPGGEIICLSSGGFGSLTINKSITINCLGTAATPGTGSNTGFIDINTGVSDRVVLRGLDLQSSADAGSIFAYAGTLILDQVKISGNGNEGVSGLAFRPTGAAKLVVIDSIFTNGGGTSTGAGIPIAPQSGGTAQVTLSRVSASGNAFGIAVDGSNSTGGINVTINDSDSASNAQDGIIATTSAGGAPIGVTVINSRSTNNAYGIRSIGSNVTVRVQGSQIIGNGTGLSGGGALLTGGGNTVQANGTNGGFTGSYAQQ